MKRWFYIGIVLLVAVLVSCERLPRPAATPSQRGTTSPWPSPGGEGVELPRPLGTPSERGMAYRTLEGIDSLMWQQPDSAFAMLQEFASSAAADSLDEFNGHYCQVLISELLYKNYYRQSNRKDLLKAVGYFDSIDDGFLAARAHYINGVGYYERDSLIEACREYLNALRMMEGHFEEKVLVGHKARFMTLTYNRLGDLFSAQFMQEPAIYCCKKSLDYDRIAQASPDKIANTLLQLGKQFGKLKEYDSAAYYFDEALKQLPDTNNLIFRDLISARAFLYYQMGKGVEPSVNDLRRKAIQTTDEKEKLNRYLTIGCIYSEEVQFDSALVYLTPVFENMEDAARQRIAARYLYEIFQNQGDTLKAAQFSMYIAGNTVSEGESNAQVSQLNELLQQHLQWEQERAKEEEHRRAVQRNRWIWMAIVGLLLLVAIAIVVTRRGYGKRLKLQQEESDKQLKIQQEESGKQLEAAQDALKAKEQYALLTKVTAIYQDKLGNKAKRIFEAFNEAHPDAVAKLKATYPDLTDTEMDVCVLSHFAFRVKEIADILELRENTVAKYRSSIKKKAQISDVESLMNQVL